MEQQRNHIAAAPRTAMGKKARFLRREGWLPANVFGGGADSQSIQLQTREIEHLLTHSSRNSLLSLDLEGSPVTVLVKGVARKPTTGELYHVDFYRISMTETLKITVPLVLTGEAPAVKNFGATLLHAMDSVEVECLPADMPTQIQVDVEGLAQIDDAIYVKDLIIPARVSILSSADDLVAKALAPSVMTAEEEAEGEAAEPTVAGATEAAEAAEQEEEK